MTEQPTPDDLARDLAADLALCKAATPGPWMTEEGRIEDDDPGYYCMVVLAPEHRTPAHCYGGGPYRRANCRMIAAARTGWPAAIRRAQSAEAGRDRLMELLVRICQVLNRLVMAGRSNPLDMLISAEDVRELQYAIRRAVLDHDKTGKTMEEPNG